MSNILFMWKNNVRLTFFEIIHKFRPFDIFDHMHFVKDQRFSQKLSKLRQKHIEALL